MKLLKSRAGRKGSHPLKIHSTGWRRLNNHPAVPAIFFLCYPSFRGNIISCTIAREKILDDENRGFLYRTSISVRKSCAISILFLRPHDLSLFPSPSLSLSLSLSFRAFICETPFLPAFHFHRRKKRKKNEETGKKEKEKYRRDRERERKSGEKEEEQDGMVARFLFSL